MGRFCLVQTYSTSNYYVYVLVHFDTPSMIPPAMPHSICHAIIVGTFIFIFPPHFSLSISLSFSFSFSFSFSLSLSLSLCLCLCVSVSLSLSLSLSLTLSYSLSYSLSIVLTLSYSLSLCVNWFDLWPRCWWVLGGITFMCYVDFTLRQHSWFFHLPVFTRLCWLSMCRLGRNAMSPLRYHINWEYIRNVWCGDGSQACILLW